MKKFLIGLMIAGGLVSAAQAQQSSRSSIQIAPLGWWQLVDGSNDILIKHYPLQWIQPNGFVTNFKTWIKTTDDSYKEISIDCRYHDLQVKMPDGKWIKTADLNPGHLWWRVREYGCR